MAVRDDEPNHRSDACNKPFRVWMLFCNFVYLILAIVTVIIGRFHIHLIATPPALFSSLLAVYCLVRSKKWRDHEPEDPSIRSPKKRGCCGCRSKGSKRGCFQRKLAIVDLLLASWFLGVLIGEWIALDRSRRAKGALCAFATMPQLVNMILHLLCCCRGFNFDLSNWLVSFFRPSRDHCPACGHRDDDDDEDDDSREPVPRMRRTRHHYLRSARSGYAVLIEDDSTTGDRTPTGRPASPQYRDEPRIPIYTPSASSGTLPPPPPPRAQSDDPQKMMARENARAESPGSGSSAWSRPSLLAASSFDGDAALPPYRAERSSQEGP